MSEVQENKDDVKGADVQDTLPEERFAFVNI